MEVPHTIIIESNKQTATEQEYQSFKDGEINTPDLPPDRSSSWKSYIENGIELEEGDKISIESSQINILGDANSTMEFNRGASAQGKDPLVDNRCAMNIGYYITNKHQNNFPLPLFQQAIDTNIDSQNYGSPHMSDWFELANAIPLMAIEGARYNAEIHQTNPGSSSGNFQIPKNIASWYLGSGSTNAADWWDESSGNYLPWFMWVGDAPLQNGPYEIYKPNETRLYKHKYKPYDASTLTKCNYWEGNYFDYDTINTDSPYFDLTENIIDIEIPEGFTTPSSVGEFITSNFIELNENKKKERTIIQKDAPTPSIFKLTGVFDTQSGKPFISQFNNPGVPLPQILERDVLTQNLNKTWTTARTPSGTVLEDYMDGNFSGSIQFPFDINSTFDENYRLFFSDILDGDVKKTSTAIKFQTFKAKAIPTDDILNHELFFYNNPAVVDSGNQIPIPTGSTNFQAIFGKQVVIMENLPRKILEYHTEDKLPRPKFWLNISGERECSLIAPQTDGTPPIDNPDPAAGDPTTIYNDNWKTCPPVAAEGATFLDMRPYSLIPTNIVATRGSIAMLKRVFNTGQYAQDNEDVDEYIKKHIDPTKHEDNLLRKEAVNNSNILDKLVVPFQVGMTDDSLTTTEGYYSTNQINLICPAMAFYYTNPNYNPSSDGQSAKNRIAGSGGLINRSYMVLGEYNYTDPQLPRAPTSMPIYATNRNGLNNIGKYRTLDKKFTQTNFTDFPEINNIPRLNGACWWNKDILDQTKITPNIRLGEGAPFNFIDFINSNQSQALDIDSQKKGKEAKYNVEVKTSWDERLDPQSNKFKCTLHGIDDTPTTSHFQFTRRNTNEYFDVKNLQGNVIKAEYPNMTDDNLSNIEKSGLGIVVVYYKEAVMDPTSGLFLGEDFLTALTKDGRNVCDIPYIAVVNMSYLTAGMDEPLNLDLLNRNKTQIPTPCIGEFFGCSLSAQDNTWSKIVNTQKTPPNMRCAPIKDPIASGSSGEEVSPETGPPSVVALNNFRTNEGIPPADVYTYPSFKGVSSFQSGAGNTAAFYRMSDYVPYVRLGSDNAAVAFDDNFGRFSLTNFHTPLFNGNKVNPFWIRVNGGGTQLSKPALDAFPKANEQFADKIKAINRFCAAISTYKAVFFNTRVRSYNFSNSLLRGWRYTEPAPCIPFSLIQSSDDVLPLQNSLSGIGVLNISVSYRNIRNPAGIISNTVDFEPTKNKQNIQNLLSIIGSKNGIQNLSNSELEKVGWKTLTPYKPLQYKGTLFDKMGYSIEQLIPFFGNQNNTFNKNNYNLYEGYEKDIIKKQRNMVLPLTTNCFISGSESIDFTTNFSNFPMKNLGTSRNGISVNATAESDSLIAVSLPRKLSYSYLVVYSDILETQNQYYGSNYLSTLPAIGYITRNYESADFFFAFSNDWSFYVDKKRMLNNFTIDIRLPNGQPALINDNSSILFKVVKKKLIGIFDKKKGTKS